VDAVWAALQESNFAALIRNSTYIYPIANITHVVAVVAFFGVVATMDLGMLRKFSGISARELVVRLRSIAFGILIVIVLAGSILFAAEATALARNVAFQLKMAAILLALLNVGLNTWSLRAYGESSFAVRFSAGFSLVAWLVIAALGRSIAYV
jgi:hypothetical protein